MTFENLVSQQLTVDRIIDGLTNRHISGHIVTNRIALRVLFAGRRGRQHDAAIFYTRAHPQLHALNGPHGQRRRNAHNPQLLALGTGKRAVFIKENKHQCVEVIFLTGVVRVGLNNQLLTRLITDQPVRPCSNRLLRVGFGVVLVSRNDAQRAQYIDKGALRRFEFNTHG